MTYSEYLKMDYDDIIKAAKKISGYADTYMDLAHYAIVELSGKADAQEVVDAGAARFYLVKIMMIQHRSVTGPFYKQFVKRNQELPLDLSVEEPEDTIDVPQVNRLLNKLDWYDKSLFDLYIASNMNYTDLAKKTGIPRTSISLTVRRVKKYLRANLKP